MNARADEAEGRIARQNDHIHRLESQSFTALECRVEGFVGLSDLPVASATKHNWRAVCLEGVRITNRSTTKPASASLQVRVHLEKSGDEPLSAVFIEDAYPFLWPSLPDLRNDLAWLHSPINLAAGETIKGNIGVLFLPKDDVLGTWRLERRGSPIWKFTLELVEHVSGTIVEVDLSSSLD